MAVGPISVTAERENVVDFATPYYDFAGIQIMIKKTEVENSMFTFTTVFSIEVWLCWFSVLGATAVLLHAFDRLSHCRCGQNSGIPTPPHDGFDLKDSFWFVIASLTLSGENSGMLGVDALRDGIFCCCNTTFCHIQQNIPNSYV